MLRSTPLAVRVGLVALALVSSGCSATTMVSPGAQPIAPVDSTMSVEPAEDSMPTAPAPLTSTPETPVAQTDPASGPPVVDVVPPRQHVVFVDASGAPIQIDEATAPYVVYGGNPVYLYQDHWYRRDGGRWAFYANEPPELARQRGYIEHAPRAHKGEKGI